MLFTKYQVKKKFGFVSADDERIFIYEFQKRKKLQKPSHPYREINVHQKHATTTGEPCFSLVYKLKKKAKTVKTFSL